MTVRIEAIQEKLTPHPSDKPDGLDTESSIATYERDSLKKRTVGIAGSSAWGNRLGAP